MSDNRFENIPFESPVLPQQLSENSKICFNCYPGISCFNACCKQADITLTPYDVLRMKNRLGMSSSEFLMKHTVPFQLDAHGMPGIKMRTTDNNPVCLFMDEKTGCTIYTDRPTACRYYPMAQLSSRRSDEYVDHQSYAVVREPHCKGHDEAREISIAEYRQEQQVAEYDEYNREFYQLILKKKSTGPAIGKPSDISFHFYFMVSFDSDRFKEFLQSTSFRSVYAISEQEFNSLLNDDYARLKFGYRLLRQVLFGEMSITMVDGALEKRMQQRGEILKARREAEIAMHQGKEHFEKYIED